MHSHKSGEFWFFLLSQKLSVCKFRLLYVMKANNCIWKIELYVAPVEQEFFFFSTFRNSYPGKEEAFAMA